MSCQTCKQLISLKQPLSYSRANSYIGVLSSYTLRASSTKKNVVVVTMLVSRTDRAMSVLCTFQQFSQCI